MTRDARFEEGGEAPLRLKAVDADDLKVVSALVQDAVFPATEIAWRRADRRFALLVNRFRWEDAAVAERRGRGYERVRSVLLIEEVTAVRALAVDPADRDTIYCLLSLDWEPGEDGAGAIVLNLAGDGAIRVEVEALEVVLRDVTRPYLSLSGRAPQHR